ncbi:UvrD-helicase domain-containing protein [Kitasatospora sp. NPDC090091]|uniref:UvrD-helicase domain-containing protein n=1 Tax=Kitasatospora sp. NPDC090091 TaxID=3364081 RepID=UPI00382F4030
MPHENRTAAARLEVKVARRPWNPALHPRDSKGRFVETGGIARLWGGGLARVLRALASDKVLVERLDSGKQERLYANRLTMVARPDGTAPTASEDKVLAEDAKREAQAAGGGRGDGITKPDAGDPRVPAKPHATGDDGQDIPDEKPTVASVLESWRRGEVRPLAADPEKPQDAQLRREAARERADAISSPQLTSSGRHLVGQQDGTWRVYEAATGRVHEGQHNSKRDALSEADALEAGPIHKQGGWQSYTSEELSAAAEKAGAPAGAAEEQPGYRWSQARLVEQGDFVVAGNPQADGGWYTRRVLDVQHDGEYTTLTWEGHGGRKETLKVANGGAADGFHLVRQPYPFERWEKDRNGDAPSADIEAEARWQSSNERGSASLPTVEPTPDASSGHGPKEPNAARGRGVWLPAGQSAQRRFGAVMDVLHHWDDEADSSSSDPDRAEKDRRSAFKVAQLTRSEQLSTNGRFMVSKTPKGQWVVHHSGTGLLISDQYGDRERTRPVFSTKREALLVANAAEQVRNDDGNLFDWDSPNLRDRLEDKEFAKAFARVIAEARGRENDGGRGAAAEQRGDQGERVRADREGVLGDVPADGDGDDGAGGRGVLRGDRRTGGDADRGDLGGDLRRAGGADGSAGRDGADEHGKVDGPREGVARADLQPGEGARNGGSGHAEGRAALDRRVVLGSPQEEGSAPSWMPPADGRSLVPSGVAPRVRANIEAIRVLRRLQDEQRPATREEQAVLARWSGWGATPQVFMDSPSEEFASLAGELRSLLSDEEWERAADSTMNAHYTDPQITRAVWGALRDLGFDGGQVLEPGAGSGNFIGYAPPNAHMTGVELDPITAGIAKALYPQSDIRAEGFEKTHLPDATFDATVGNVPFGNYEVVDLRHNKGNHRIHNHFIIKSLDLTRPGGIVAVVTSRYTMDGNSVRAEDARMEMARKADLLGAIRLPSSAHQRTAGTGVVTDLLIFRRRDGEKEFTSGRDRKKAIKPLEERGPNDPPMWVHSAPATDLPGQDPEAPVDPKERVFVNPYFAEHPDRVLGQMAIGHGAYRANDLRVDGDGHLAPALDHALKQVVDQARSNGLAYRQDDGGRPKPRLLEAGSTRVDGHVQIEPDGTLTQVRDGQVHQFDVPKTQAEEARALLGLRDAFKALVTAENAPENDEPLIEKLRGNLKARYDAYHRQFGAINRFEWRVRKATDPDTGQQVEKAIRHRPPRGGLFTKDPTMAMVKALDTYDTETGTSTASPIFTRRIGRHRAIAETAESPQDAAVLVHERVGHLDVDELARVMRTSPDEARARLLAARSVDPATGEEMPLAFEVPGDGSLEMAADYLSGDVRAKLNEAATKAGTDPRFRTNVEQLEKVLPPDIPAGEIDAPLGASWLGAGPVQAFLSSIMHEPVKVEYQGGSLWKVEAKAHIKKSKAATEVWGTQDYPAPKLIEAILTNSKIQVRRYRDDGTSWVDVDATDLAQTKAEELGDRFQDWLWEDPKRAEAIKKAYNDTHNNLALRSYDGQRRTMPGLSEHFVPHDHQHAAVARMVNEPAVLLAHEVGAGKTAEMAMGVMELRRLGLVNKPVIVVPGHMLQQFHDEFLELYQDAKLMAAGSEDLEGRKRREFIARVATTDCDAVILTQRAFESIDMRPETQLAYINREKESLKRALARAKGERAVANADRPASGRETRMVKEIRKRLKNLEAKIEKKTAAMKDKAGLSFEDTGIDYVVVDEAHHYKNLATNSSIPGAGIEGSNRASDLDMKLDYLRGRTQSGRVVTFATATPISNSVTEAHTMLRYLRPDLLEQARIRDFDEFASTYGKIINGVELAADGSGFREVSRFAAFRNMPELMRIWRTVADVKTAEDLDLDVPDLSTGRAITIKVEPTEGQLEYQADLERRAHAVKNGLVDPSDDNMLKISSDGRKVSLDPRMVGVDEPGHKLRTAAENILRIHAATKDTEYPTSKDDPTPHPTKGGLQFVFLDMGTPKDPNKKKGKGKKQEQAADLDELSESAFPAYAELKALLVDGGIPADKVRFIHEAKNDAEKARLFHEARTGKIAVLVGSTTKMGTGTNAQLRATALHHLDCPWRPADLEQRNGRIIRQGNANPEVSIFQYVTEQSFDGFSWQTVARKAKFIKQLMKGNLTDRTVEDIPDGVFNAEQVTAISTGNPYLLEQANVRASLGLLRRQHKAYLRGVDGARLTIQQTEELREQTASLVAKLQSVNQRKRVTRGNDFNASFDGKDLTSRKEAAAELSRLAHAVIDEGRTNPWGTHAQVRLGQVGGIDVVGKFRVGYRDGARVYVADISMPDVPGSRRSYTKAMLDGESLTPITRLEDSLTDTEAHIETAQSMLRREERNAEIAAERLNKPFEKAAELETAEERSRLVNAIISAQSKPVTGDEAARDARRRQIEALEQELREARIRAGEDPAATDDPSAEHDLDVTPRTPAPPVVSTDAAGRPTVTWPDREARKEQRRLKAQRRAKDAAEKRSADQHEDNVPQDLTPQSVQSDLASIGPDSPSDAAPRGEEQSARPDSSGASPTSGPDWLAGAGQGAVEPAAQNGTPQADIPDAEDTAAPAREERPHLSTLTDEQIADEMASLEPDLLGDGEVGNEDVARHAQLVKEQTRRAENAKTGAPKGPGGSWMEMQAEQAGGADPGLFGAADVLAAQPTERAGDEFGTPDMFADAEGATGRLKAANLRTGDRYIADDGTVAEVAGKPEAIGKGGRGGVRVRTTDGRTLMHRPDHTFRRADDTTPSGRRPGKGDAQPATTSEAAEEAVTATAAQEAAEGPKPPTAPAAAEEGTADQPYEHGTELVTPDGTGHFIGATGGQALVNVDGTYVMHPLSDVHQPGEQPVAEALREAAAADEDRQVKLAQAATPEGLSLRYGARLHSLDMEAGHGWIVDEDGNTIGWVRSRPDDKGRTAWWGQDARGGAPESMTWHDKMPATAGIPPIRTANHVAQGIELNHRGEKTGLWQTGNVWKEVTFTEAQVRELAPLAQPDPDEPIAWKPGFHRRYTLRSDQMRTLRATARAAADEADTSTTAGRRQQKVLRNAADKLDREAYETDRSQATLPRPGEPDPFAEPYKAAEETPDVPDTPVAPNGAADPAPGTTGAPADGSDRGVLSSRPVAEMGHDELDDELSDLEAALDEIKDSTDPLALAWRRRAELRQWEVQKELNRKTEVGKPEDRGEEVQNRLWGYGLRADEGEGRNVERIEDMPSAKAGAPSDEEWARIVASAAEQEEYPPTAEQALIHEAVARRSLNAAVMALAGTGKSSTLKQLSRRMPGKRIDYLAFNRSVAEEAKQAKAKGEYADNVTPQTANGMAFRAVNKRYQEAGRDLGKRLPQDGDGGAKRQTAQTVADLMRVYDWVEYTPGQSLKPSSAAYQARDIISRWSQSADEEMGPQHLNLPPWIDEEHRGALFEALKPIADRMWADILDPHGQLTYDQDYIVKQWALSGFKVDSDVIFFDEAQDVNPVLDGVVRAAMKQGVQVVAVGDSNQSIYGFRGATDALARFPVDARLTLTQSFRFGEEIAEIGNRFLRLSGTEMRLKGLPSKDSRITELGPDDADAVLCRTNATAVIEAIDALDRGKRVAVAGGLDEIRKFVEAARQLQAGERTNHKDLADFAAWDDVVEYVEQESEAAGSMRTLVQLIENDTDGTLDRLLESGGLASDIRISDDGERLWISGTRFGDPDHEDFTRWLKDAKANGFGKAAWDDQSKRWYYQPGTHTVTNRRSGRTWTVKNPTGNRDAAHAAVKEYIDRHSHAPAEGEGGIVGEHQDPDVVISTAHKSKGLEWRRVRIAADFRGPELNEDGRYDLATMPSDEDLRLSYVAVTRATEALDAGGLGWVWEVTRSDDPMERPDTDYLRDWTSEDFTAGDTVLYIDDDGERLLTGEVVAADGVLTVRDQESGRRSTISLQQVRRRNGDPQPRAEVASDEDLQKATDSGRFTPPGTRGADVGQPSDPAAGDEAGQAVLSPEQVGADLESIAPDAAPSTDATTGAESASSPLPGPGDFTTYPTHRDGVTLNRFQPDGDFYDLWRDGRLISRLATRDGRYFPYHPYGISGPKKRRGMKMPNDFATLEQAIDQAVKLDDLDGPPPVDAPDWHLRGLAEYLLQTLPPLGRLENDEEAARLHAAVTRTLKALAAGRTDSGSVPQDLRTVRDDGRELAHLDGDPNSPFLKMGLGIVFDTLRPEDRPHRATGEPSTQDIERERREFDAHRASEQARVEGTSADKIGSPADHEADDAASASGESRSAEDRVLLSPEQVSSDLQSIAADDEDAGSERPGAPTAADPDDGERDDSVEADPSGGTDAPGVVEHEEERTEDGREAFPAPDAPGGDSDDTQERDREDRDGARPVDEDGRGQHQDDHQEAPEATPAADRSAADGEDREDGGNEQRDLVDGQQHDDDLGSDRAHDESGEDKEDDEDGDGSEDERRRRRRRRRGRPNGVDLNVDLDGPDLPLIGAPLPDGIPLPLTPAPTADRPGRVPNPRGRGAAVGRPVGRGGHVRPPHGVVASRWNPEEGGQVPNVAGRLAAAAGGHPDDAKEWGELLGEAEALKPLGQFDANVEYFLDEHDGPVREFLAERAGMLRADVEAVGQRALADYLERLRTASSPKAAEAAYYGSYRGDGRRGGPGIVGEGRYFNEVREAFAQHVAQARAEAERRGLDPDVAERFLTHANGADPDRKSPVDDDSIHDPINVARHEAFYAMVAGLPDEVRQERFPGTLEAHERRRAQLGAVEADQVAGAGRSGLDGAEAPGEGERVAGVRERFTSGAGIPGSAKNRAYVARIGANPTLGVSPGGGVAYWSKDGGRTWEFGHARTGATVGSRDASTLEGTQDDAAAMAARYEQLVDADGRPFPWDAEDAQKAGRGWRDAEGRKIGDAMRAVRDEHAAASNVSDDAREGQPDPDMPTMDGTDQVLPDDLTDVDEGLLEAHLVVLGDRAAAANDWDNPELHRVADELDRRTAQRRDSGQRLTPLAAQASDVPPADDAERAAEEELMDQLAAGLPPTKESRREYLERVEAERQRLRHQYDNEYTPTIKNAVEEYTKGYLVRRESAQKARAARAKQEAEDARAAAEDRPARRVAAGGRIDDPDYILFEAPQSVYDRHASDELREWVEYHNGGQRPVSFTRYYQEHLAGERQARERWEEEQEAARAATPDGPAPVEGTPGDGELPRPRAGDARPAGTDDEPSERPSEGPSEGPTVRPDADDVPTAGRPEAEVPVPAERPARLEELGAPEPVGGRPAQWVAVDQLQQGDVARVEGTDMDGNPIARSGWVLGRHDELISQGGHFVRGYEVTIAEDVNGVSGRRGVVFVPAGAQAARASARDEDAGGGALLSGAQLEAMNGRLDGNHPTDRHGEGLFPGSLVRGPGGREGLVTGVTGSTASVRYDGRRHDQDAAPGDLEVTDGGAARPAGWTRDGQHIKPGQVAVDPDSRRPLGVVQSVDGDNVQVATPDGVLVADGASVTVARGAQPDEAGPAIVDLRPVAAGDLADGDVVLVDDAGRKTPVRVVGRPDLDGDSVTVDYEEVKTGARGQLRADRALLLQRATSADGRPADLAPQEAVTGIDDTRRVTPVVAEPEAGAAVTPQLSPVERARIHGLGLGNGDDPQAQQGAERIDAGLPVTVEQAQALEEVLRQHSDPGTGEGRTAGRAADRLAEASGGTPQPAGEEPVPGTAGDLVAGDRVAVPQGDGTSKPVMVTGSRPGPGGTQAVTLEDAYGIEEEEVLPAAAPVHHLPDPPAPAAGPGEARPAAPSPAPQPRTGDVVAARARDAIDAVVQAAVDGVVPDTIHALRQSVAERLAPGASRSGERRAAASAAEALRRLGLDETAHAHAEQAVRHAAQRAREAAVRAVLRTLNDLEPLDGESEEETAERAVRLLRRIPEGIDPVHFALVAMARSYRAAGSGAAAPAGAGERARQQAGRSVAAFAGRAVGSALGAAVAAVRRRRLDEQQVEAIVQRAVRAMADGQEEVAREILDGLPAQDRPGLSSRVMAALVRLARRIALWLRELLRKVATAMRGEDGRRLERVRERLLRRLRWWPEAQEIEAAVTAAAEDAQEASDAADLTPWLAMLPAGRFGRVERTVSHWDTASTADLEAGRLPEAVEERRWVADRAVDGGPGPEALRHLAAVRGAGEVLDGMVTARMEQVAPELGASPHRYMESVRSYTQSAIRRADRIAAEAAAGSRDAELELDSARAEARQARADEQRVQAAYAVALRDAASDALGQVRPMGPGNSGALQADGEGAERMRGLSAFLPTEWLAAAGPVTVSSGAQRGSYDPQDRHLALGENDAPALHALAHHLQHSVPELVAAEEAYHWVRTSRGEVGMRERAPQVRLAELFPGRGHHPQATARQGGWPELFTGSEPADGRSWEVLPTALEAMFTGSTWYLDDDLRQWLLGVMSTLGRRA